MLNCPLALFGVVEDTGRKHDHRNSSQYIDDNAKCDLEIGARHEAENDKLQHSTTRFKLSEIIHLIVSMSIILYLALTLEPSLEPLEPATIERSNSNGSGCQAHDRQIRLV